jgi:hypothetical protein
VFQPQIPRTRRRGRTVNALASVEELTSGSMEIMLCPASRLAVVRFVSDTNLTDDHGLVLVEALRRVLGANGETFGLLANAGGVRGTDADFRAITGAFFSEHRDTACVAAFNLGPVVRIVTEMFGVGTGIELRPFAPRQPLALGCEREVSPHEHGPLVRRHLRRYVCGFHRRPLCTGRYARQPPAG